MDVMHGRAGTVLRVCGVLLVLYWGVHFLWHLQYWDVYASQTARNAFLGPVFRASIDVLAVIAGIFAIRRSTWFFAPFLLHCLACAWMLGSIVLPFARGALGLWVWGIIPLNFQLTFIAQLLILAVTTYAVYNARRKAPGAK